MGGEEFARIKFSKQDGEIRNKQLCFQKSAMQSSPLAIIQKISSPTCTKKNRNITLITPVSLPSKAMHVCFMDLDASNV